MTEPSKNIIRTRISLLSHAKREAGQSVLQTRQCIIMGNILKNSGAPEWIPARKGNLKSIRSYSSYINHNFVEIHGWDFCVATTGRTRREHLNNFASFYCDGWTYIYKATSPCSIVTYFCYQTRVSSKTRRQILPLFMLVMSWWQKLARFVVVTNRDRKWQQLAVMESRLESSVLRKVKS